MQTKRIQILMAMLVLVLACGSGAGSAYAVSDVNRVTGGGTLDTGDRFAGSIQCRAGSCSTGIHGAWFMETVAGNRFRATEFTGLLVIIDAELRAVVTGYGIWDGDVVMFRIDAYITDATTARLHVLVLDFSGTTIIADFGGWVDRGNLNVIQAGS